MSLDHDADWTADKREPWWSILCRNARLVVPLALLQTLIYLTLNHDPFASARELPLTALDRWVPFWPWTVGPYLLLVVSGAVWPLLIRDPARLRRLLLAYVVAMTLAVCCYVFFPTTYPRPPAPRTASWSSVLYHWLIQVDSPGCCFPSGHIIVPALGCWALCRENSRWRTWLPPVLGVLALTTLTTKQHYVWDLLGGLAVAGFGVTLSRVIVGQNSDPVKDE
jgi:hypothetical protein